MGAVISIFIAGFLMCHDVIAVEVFTCILMVAVAWVYIAAGLYFKFGFLKFYYHDFLHWHTPDGSPQWHDGCSEHSICKHCGQDIMQDSQGNWF